VLLRPVAGGEVLEGGVLAGGLCGSAWLRARSLPGEQRLLAVRRVGEGETPRISPVIPRCFQTGGGWGSSGIKRILRDAGDGARLPEELSVELKTRCRALMSEGTEEELRFFFLLNV